MTCELKITLSFRNYDSHREEIIDNVVTSFYEDFDYETFSYEVNSEATVKEIYEHALEIINKFDKSFIDKYVIFSGNIMFMFFIQNYSREVSEIVENNDVKILNVLNYLGIGREFKLFNCAWGVGETWKIIEGVKFFTHSNEENHKHIPHIHTIYDSEDATYYILTSKKIAGKKYPSKVEKKIKKEITDNRQELLKFWKDTTNGILNPHFPHIEKI